MIRLIDILTESYSNKSLTEEVNDISFKFNSEKGITSNGVLLHEIITIDTFDTPDKEGVKFTPYHLIFGESSLSIFDAFELDEIAGLTRKECEEHINKLKSQGKDETEDAYIAGLSNWAEAHPFQFFNVTRLLRPGFSNRVLIHESLHVTRMLITISENEFVRKNQGKPNWWEDKRAGFTEMTDNNEEYFAESLERIGAIAFNRWEKVKGMLKK